MEIKKVDINSVKKALSKELLENIRHSNDNRILDVLVLSGYSYEEITEMLTRYQEVASLDLFNCNEVVKHTLHR